MDLPALAISGSNLLSAGAFTTALVTDQGRFMAHPTGDARPDLAVMVRGSCREARITLGAVREVLVDRGPGSYVGLRVAVTFARFVASFNGARLRSADSLQMIAARWLAEAAADSAHSRVVPIIDGRGGRVHCAAFGVERGQLRTVLGARAIEAKSLPEVLAPGDLVLAAPGLTNAIELPSSVSVHEASAPTAADLLSDRVTLEDVTPEALEPLYLMGSYVG